MISHHSLLHVLLRHYRVELLLGNLAVMVQVCLLNHLLQLGFIDVLP